LRVNQRAARKDNAEQCEQAHGFERRIEDKRELFACSAKGPPERFQHRDVNGLRTAADGGYAASSV
jgi:hypothetical protein